MESWLSSGVTLGVLWPKEVKVRPEVKDSSKMSVLHSGILQGRVDLFLSPRTVSPPERGCLRGKSSCQFRKFTETQ